MVVAREPTALLGGTATITVDETMVARRMARQESSARSLLVSVVGVLGSRRVTIAVGAGNIAYIYTCKRCAQLPRPLHNVSFRFHT